MFQMRVKAMFIIRRAGREHAAAAQVELFPRERDGVAQADGIDERPEVARAVVLLEAREGEVRNRVVQIHLQHQISFVVAEHDVEARLEFLDELAFEQERLRFAADGVNVKITNRLDERVEFQVPAHAPAGLEILADALPQIERLADVNHRAEPVAMQIHAGLVRHGADFFADGIADWHRNNLQRKSIFGDEELRRIQTRISRICTDSIRENLCNPCQSFFFMCRWTKK